MEELVECDKFLSQPDTEPREFIDYFNLEYGLYQFDENEPPFEDAFKEEDFKFIGFFISKSGQERMYFSVNGKENLFAISVPLTNGQTMLSMTDESYIGLKEFTFTK
ncbi:hypothetical protein [Saccharophagus degradans]|uniref:Uncharacterized protein n=1 Tax=Saccharophagus degradans (strain 2-40 / ATCC 43961 / DSM 17024) TaxID=203122 RepID=Q21G38_SACD2|nr:hypothetical protein [Saccharophagus degradans]ABD82341.1 hypothetical protein Sde_3084 [Saccharophagus degradans 2-40]